MSETKQDYKFTHTPDDGLDPVSETKQNYEFTYTRFFNIFFHVGVVINVVLVTWMILVFTEII